MISVKELRFGYSKVLVIDGVGMDLAAGECIALLGPNGCGKSTLLKLILKILKPTSGVILIDGHDLSNMGRREIAKHLGYAEQTGGVPDFSVFEAVLTGRLPHGSGRPSAADRTIVAETIESMGLEELAQRRLGTLSGGQLQRVIIARALAQRPEVLLLDEPTNHLDMRAQIEVAQQIEDAIVRFDIAAFLVLHDVNMALRIADRLVFLKNGRLAANIVPGDLSAQLVEEVYGVPVDVAVTAGRPFVIPRWKRRVGA